MIKLGMNENTIHAQSAFFPDKRSFFTTNTAIWYYMPPIKKSKVTESLVDFILQARKALIESGEPLLSFEKIEERLAESRPESE